MTAISQPAVFLLQLVDERSGPHWVTVDFYHRSRNAGSLTLEVAVRGFNFLRGGTRRAANVSDEDGAAAPTFGTASVVRAVDGVTIPQGTPLPAADVELRITRDADGRTLHFHLHSKKLPALDGRGVGSIVFNDLSRPDQFFERLVERLSGFAAQAGADLPGDEALRMEDEVADLGVELYEQLFPAPLRQVYWELKARRDDGELNNLLIVSDEPWIPWELVKPYDVVDGRDVEDDHLAGAWCMSRWLAGAAVPSDLNIRSARLVAPMMDLDFVVKEIQYFDSLGARQIEIAPPITTRAQFLELAEQGGAQLFHFASHGNYNQAFVDESPIVLEGEPLFPSDLTRRRARGLRRERTAHFPQYLSRGPRRLQPDRPRRLGTAFGRSVGRDRLRWHAVGGPRRIGLAIRTTILRGVVGRQDAGRGILFGAAATARHAERKSHLAGLYALRAIPTGRVFLEK